MCFTRFHVLSVLGREKDVRPPVFRDKASIAAASPNVNIYQFAGVRQRKAALFRRFGVKARGGRREKRLKKARGKRPRPPRRQGVFCAFCLKGENIFL